LSAAGVVGLRASSPGVTVGPVRVHDVRSELLMLHLRGLLVSVVSRMQLAGGELAARKVNTVVPK
jgi:hypothetical protein